MDDETWCRNEEIGKTNQGYREIIRCVALDDSGKSSDDDCTEGQQPTGTPQSQLKEIFLVSKSPFPLSGQR